MIAANNNITNCSPFYVIHVRNKFLWRPFFTYQLRKKPHQIHVANCPNTSELTSLNDVKGNVNTACFSLFLRARRWDVIRCNLYDTQSLHFQHAYSSYI